MPPSSHTNAGNPVSWVRYAQGDLRLAEADPPTGVYLELLCFHAQQAAEKAFKGVLLALTNDTLPRTHDLVFLLDLLRAASAPEPLPLTAVAAQRLTQYAGVTRYPADLGEVDEAEWQQAVADARSGVAWAERVVGMGGEH